jgi:outer membrane receptor protein involved in Fe transport
LLDTLQYQYNTNENPLTGLRLKADYVRKFGDLSWESGYQYRFLSHPGDFLYLDRDLKNDRWVENPEFSNRIELRREIHSLYSQVSGKRNRLSYGLGLRLEYMDRQVQLDQPDTTYVYQILQPFPTLNLQYDLGKGWVAKTGYSRRIERTTTFKMTPFPEREHNETLEQGDAELLPEFIHLAELGLVKTFGDNSFFATGYFRHVQNLINRVNTIYNDSILNRIYTNAGNAEVWGVEMGSNLYPAKWCELALGGNLYQYRIQGELFGEAINTAQLVYSLNATATFHLPTDIRLQAGFNYLSQQVSAQGVDSRFYNPSLSLRKTFLQGRMDLSLQWLSIDLGLLESNEQRITTSRDNFFTTTNYVYEVDRVLLSLSYRFNQPSKQMKFIQSEFGEKEF